MDMEEKIAITVWANNAARSLIDHLWHEKLIRFEDCPKAVAVAEKFLSIEIEKLDE